MSELYRLFFVCAGERVYMKKFSADAAAVPQRLVYTPGEGIRRVVDGAATIEETLDLTYAASPAAEADLAKLGRWFARLDSGLMQAPVSMGLGAPGGSEASVRHSRLVSARIEGRGAGFAGREQGEISLRIRLVREDAWEAALATPLALINSMGSNADGQQIYNHSDAAHENFVDLESPLALGDLPARLAVTLTLPAGASHTLEDVILCGQGFDSAYQFFNPILEDTSLQAGAGVTRTTFSDAACSGGSFVRLAWSGAAETKLCERSLPWVTGFNGRPARPLLRLANTPAAADLFTRLRLAYGGVGLSETQWVQAGAGSGLVEYPALQIPPGLEQPGGSLADLTLEVWARRSSGGATSLDVDYLLLAPCEAFRRYTALSPLGSGSLFDDPITGLVYTVISDGGGRILPGHGGRGQPLQIEPDRCYRFWLANFSATRFVPGEDFYLRMYAYPRWRNGV